MDSYIGKPLPRLEDQRFLTGKACYTADIDLPGQAYAVVLRSPHAHAEIEDIDVESRAAGAGRARRLYLRPSPRCRHPADPIAHANAAVSGF